VANVLATSPGESKLKNWNTQIQDFPAFLGDYLPLQLMPVGSAVGRTRPSWRARTG
jgi:hypothetical protein